jgi:ribosome maturation factor RimP
MDQGSIERRIRDIAKAAAEAKKLEFVHAELAGTRRNAVVRVYIDKPGGVTIDECGDLSRDIEAVLDIEDLIPSSYVLEVSSPGLERELYSLDDFLKFTGNRVKVKTRADIQGRRTFKGFIVGVADEEIRLDDGTAGEVTIPHSEVAKANLVFDLAEELKRN